MKSWLFTLVLMFVLIGVAPGSPYKTNKHLSLKAPSQSAVQKGMDKVLAHKVVRR